MTTILDYFLMNSAFQLFCWKSAKIVTKSFVTSNINLTAVFGTKKF